MLRVAMPIILVALAGCAGEVAVPAPTGATASPADADAALAACRSALALRAGVDPVFALPISSAATPAGREAFLSVEGDQWLCNTDPRGNVSGLTPWNT